jgi:pimeloyl-ACP methyl ester carboxylesterase
MSMADQSGYLEVEGGKLYYEMAGEGHTLVLCHAGFVDGRMWDDQWAAFRQRYRVVRFYMRGYGRSDPAQGPVSRRDELAAVLSQLQIERACLLGCSLSGATILDFALEHPDKVAALIPVSAVPNGFELQGGPPPNLIEMIQAAQQGDDDRTSELQIRIWVDGMFRQPEQVDAAVRQHAADMNRIAVRNKTWAIADTQPVNPLDPPATTRLKAVQAPTLVIAGALDHPEILRAADVMAAEIPNARKLVIQDAAHVPNMEQPDGFNRAVLDFLDSLD